MSDNSEILGTFDPSTATFRGNARDDRLRHNLVMEEHTTLHKQGWSKATVINLHNFDLVVHLGNMGTMRIPGRKTGEPFVKHVIHLYRISLRDLGDAIYTPKAVLPVELAQEFMREYPHGVFWYKGDGDPDIEQLREADTRLMLWYHKIHREAVDAWTRYRQHRMITDRQRDAAREMFARGEVEKLPEWVQATRQESSRKMCEVCGEDVKAQAKMCRFCGNVFDKEYFANRDVPTAPAKDQVIEEHEVVDNPDRQKPFHKRK